MPGVNVYNQDSQAPRTSPTDTGQTFAAVLTERGPSGIISPTSFTDFKRLCGARTSWNARFWDAVESFYLRGGGPLFLTRLAGDAADFATGNLMDAVPAVSLIATAVGVGDWYDGINIAVEDDGGNRRVVISHDDDDTISETSPSFATQEELVAWSQSSKYIRLALGVGTALPAVATVSLAGGDDDRDAIDDESRIGSLDVFDKEMGPGQVSIPGAVTLAAWEGILDHCEANNRDAVLAYPDTSDETTLIALADSVRASGRFGAAFAGWLYYPGGGGTTKTVPPELAICAQIAGWDASTDGLGQNKPVAGLRRGVINRAIGVTQADSDEWRDRETRNRLGDAGVNLIRVIRGQVVIYGWRSLADPVNDEGWTNFGHRRLQTALTAKAEAAMEPYVFEEITATMIKEINGVIDSTVIGPYKTYGSITDSLVDTDSVNDAASAEAKEVNVAMTVVEAEFAETINVYITKKTTTEGVGA